MAWDGRQFAERRLISDQFNFLAKTTPGEKDIDYWMGRALPSLVEEIEVHHRLAAEHGEDGDG